jgi:hypothetical protein
MGTVEARGRLCIFDPPYTVASARVGDHATFGWMAVIEFAGEYESDEARYPSQSTTHSDHILMLVNHAFGSHTDVSQPCIRITY